MSRITTRLLTLALCTSSHHAIATGICPPDLAQRLAEIPQLQTLADPDLAPLQQQLTDYFQTKVSTPCLQLTAPKGNAYAQTMLAVRYRFGQGVAKDQQKSLYWLTKAADQGNAYAAKQLSFIYEDGKGIKADPKRAFDMLLIAVKSGAPDIQYRLALKYLDGIGTTENDELAAHWLQLAAAQGHSNALLALGVLYEQGKGVSPNSALAQQLIQASADQGNVMAQQRLEGLPSLPDLIDHPLPQYDTATTDSPPAPEPDNTLVEDEQAAQRIAYLNSLPDTGKRPILPKDYWTQTPRTPLRFNEAPPQLDMGETSAVTELRTRAVAPVCTSGSYRSSWAPACDPLKTPTAEINMDKLPSIHIP